MFEETVEYGDVKFTLRNTVKAIIRYRKWVGVLGEELDEEGFELTHLYVAAHTVAVEGMKWRPPSDNATRETLLKNYDELCGSVSMEFLLELNRTCSELHAPLSSEMEMPEELVPESSKEADPN